MSRNRWIALGAGLGVVALVAFLAFRPDKLFVDDEVDEQLGSEVEDALAATTTTAVVPPSSGGGEATSTTAPSTTEPPVAVVARGDFRSQGNYTVIGQAAVVEENGRRQLVLPDLDSSNGPDLQLYFSPSPDGSVDGGVYIAPLKGNQGTQSYEIDSSVDITAVPNVVIWCERFGVAFGTATLS